MEKEAERMTRKASHHLEGFYAVEWPSVVNLTGGWYRLQLVLAGGIGHRSCDLTQNKVRPAVIACILDCG